MDRKSLHVPALAKADPEFARQRFNAELDERRFVEAAQTFMVSLYHRAIALMETEDFHPKWKDEPVDGFGPIFGIIDDLTTVVEEQGDSAPFNLQIALEAFTSIARTKTILLGLDADCEEEKDTTAKLLLAAAAMGNCDTFIALCENGHWEDFSSAKSKLFTIGRTQRGRKAAWEAGFLPHAKSYCEGKERVTFGQLRGHARAWAEDERKASRNPELPATDDGINAGLRRMESSGGLSIPGRRGG